MLPQAKSRFTQAIPKSETCTCVLGEGMAELYDLTIAEAREKLDRGKITSVELTQALLDRIVAVDNQVRAFLAINDEQALDQARVADEQRRKGAAQSPL